MSLKLVLYGLISAYSDSRPERVDFRPERADFRAGRTWGWMDQRTDRMRDGQINKSPPVFYRTSSCLGPLPKRKSAHLG